MVERSGVMAYSDPITSKDPREVLECLADHGTATVEGVASDDKIYWPCHLGERITWPDWCFLNGLDWDWDPGTLRLELSRKNDARPWS